MKANHHFVLLVNWCVVCYLHVIFFLCIATLTVSKKKRKDGECSPAQFSFISQQSTVDSKP